MNAYGWYSMRWVSNHSSHPGGRILILWKDNIVHLDVTFFFSQLIQCIVTINGLKLEISTMYGFSDEVGHITLWNDIRRLHNYVISPWIIIGDFNAIWFVER